MTQAEKDQLASLHAAAVQAVDQLLAAPPERRNEIVDSSKRTLVRLRDGLIEQFRAEQNGQKKNALRIALDQANTAVSLMTGVEYPGSGIQEKLIRQARDVLVGMHV